MSLSGNSGNNFDGFTTRGDGATFINIERKNVPQWAFVGGIIGILFLLIGLLLWLVRTTETAQITLKDAPNGCEVQIIGTTSPAIADQINMVLSGMLH